MGIDNTGEKLPALTINYNSPAELRSFMDLRGLGMRKKYGQNFLVNPGIRERLLDALEIKPGDAVWEIGPGLGSMTRGLLERGGRLIAFEIDPAFSKILMELFGTDKNFTLIEGDALKTWPTAIQEEELLLFGNLPYNIAAALLGDFIEKKRFFRRMVVTVQRETAQRMIARPGTRDYSSFTVLCSSVYKITPLEIIKGASFYPVPRVDSQGVRFELPEKILEYPKVFQPLVRGLFSSRRKTIQNNLFNFLSSVIMKDGKGLIRETLGREALDLAGISGNRRAETLEIEEFAVLARILEELLDRGK